ncbi:flagellar protein FliT [Massilia frigida]|nr:flagellar protein FliT [Massilia frigida]
MTMTNDDVLSTYEAMLALSAQMVSAAESGEWDELSLLEKRVGAHVAALQANDEQVLLEDASRVKKVAIIKQLLAYDRIIRDLTTPWMAQLSQLINSSGTSRRLNNAYGGV